MSKQITETMLGYGSDYKTNRYFVRLPSGFKFAYLLEPGCWTQVVQQQKLNLHDLIRVRADDGSFDVQLTATSIVKGGATVEIWPKMPLAG